MSATGQLKNFVSSSWTTQINLYQPGSAMAGADQRFAVYDLAWEQIVPGGVDWRRQLAESFYIDGAFQINQSKQMSNHKFTFMVTGYSFANLQTNITALVAVISKRWQLWLQPDGSTDIAWQCETSGVEIGYSAAHLAGVWAPVVASGIRQPIPLAGAA